MEKDKFFTNGTRSPLSPNWQSSSLGMDSRLVDVNCFPEQMQSCFPSLSWENSVNQNVQFESALSSIASSSALAVSNAGNPDDNVVIRELIGRLGGICNAGEISPHHQTLSGAATSYSTNASCHSTPMNSPPKLNLSAGLGNSVMAHPSLAPFSADPGFAERAAKYSFFGSGNFGAMTSQLGLPPTELPYRSLTRVESGKLSRVSSSQSLKVGSQLGPMDGKETALSDGLDAEMRSVSASPSASDRKFGRLSRSSTPDDTEFGNTHEESSPSEWTAVGESGLNGFPNDNNARKRKGVPRGRAKELPSSPLAKDPKTVEEDDSNAKRSKSTEADANGKDGVKTKTEPNATQNVADDTHKQNKINEKPPEPPKQDYIHVRARRGQATDSHSLAERVRREKISERMKLLQDLVPGCNKVTGKAVMLDEIINYVQSLQRQVEFLSMKLANVNPRMDFNMDALLSKDALQSRGPLANSMYSFDSSASAILYGQRSQHGTMPSLASSGSEVLTCANPLGPRQNLGIQLPTVAGYNASSESFWEDDLQSVVQMGFGQNQETAFPSYSFPGSTPTSHMKIEP